MKIVIIIRRKSKESAESLGLRASLALPQVGFACFFSLVITNRVCGLCKVTLVLQKTAMLVLPPLLRVVPALRETPCAMLRHAVIYWNVGQRQGVWEVFCWREPVCSSCHDLLGVPHREAVACMNGATLQGKQSILVYYSTMACQ